MSSSAAASSTKITLETKRAFRQRRRWRQRCCWACRTAHKAKYPRCRSLSFSLHLANSQRNNPRTSRPSHTVLYSYNNNFRLRTRRFLCAYWQPLVSSYLATPPPCLPHPTTRRQSTQPQTLTI